VDIPLISVQSLAQFSELRRLNDLIVKAMALGACVLTHGTEKCQLCTENCQFGTEKCQFRTEKYQFGTEKCQFRTEKCQFGTTHIHLVPPPSAGQLCIVSLLSGLRPCKGEAKIGAGWPGPPIQGGPTYGEKIYCSEISAVQFLDQ
jgi:hypothetical protein